MTFQSTINVNLGFGVPGDILFDAPRRAVSVILNSQVSLTSLVNYVGFAYTRSNSTGNAMVGGSLGTGAASVTGSISGTTMTVTAVSSGSIVVGQVISGASVTSGTTVLAVLTGTGGAGTYLVDRSSTATSTTLTGTGTGVVFGGVLAMPKDIASIGTTAGGPLAPTLAVPDLRQVDLLQEGIIVVSSTGAANIGDQVQWNCSTGAISCVAPGASASANNVLISGASVDRYPTGSAGLIAIHLNS